MEPFLIIGAILVVFLIIGTFIGIAREKKYFNAGKCPKCNIRLKCFDRDSQGGRGYICNKCGYTTWVSYRSVDRVILRPRDAYTTLRPHIGHNVVCVCYGKDGEDPVDICIECEDCGEVLISSETYDDAFDWES